MGQPVVADRVLQRPDDVSLADDVVERLRTPLAVQGLGGQMRTCFEEVLQRL
ncbi:MAG TPA: hypothetical protein VFB34_06105 [Chloroflexota bacterium]|nr:hypothetical protein [Chloroflexota bacterium]